MRKTTLKSLLVVFAAVLTSTACVTTPYVAPQNGPLADLVIRVQPIMGRKYTLDVYDNDESCSGAKTVVEDSGKGSVLATKLHAEKLVTMGYFEVQGNVSCQYNFSFYPKTDHVYLIDSMSLGNGCRIAMLDYTDKKNPTRVPVIRRTEKTLICLPLDKSK
ncbi:hypothetical protein ACO0LF_24885 [Undibacterium sp. Di27W]|uniref:hypothetical protein n=1 Tax=Undibacterium sp. Di27W TaxID=3413036 RepID=UPI003BEF97D6